MHTIRLTLLSLAILAIPMSALAATTASYRGTDTTCPIYGPDPAIEQPIVSCRLDDAGSVRVGACDAIGCDLFATGSASASWDPPGFGYLQSGLGQFYPNMSVPICIAYANQAPSNGASCSGASPALHATVAPGACRYVFVSTSAVFDYVTFAQAPVVPYVAVYLATRIDHQFTLCRDASGAPSIQNDS